MSMAMPAPNGRRNGRGGTPTVVTVRVRALDGVVNEIQVPSKCNGRAIWNAYTKVFDLNEQDFFSLTYIPSEPKGKKKSRANYDLGWRSTQWLLLDEPVLKQLGVPQNGTWELEFRVKFYVTQTVTCRWDDYARFLFYLQLRDDLSTGRLDVEEATAVELAGYAVQAQFGDYDTAKHEDGSYLSNMAFVPNQTPALEALLTEAHKKLSGLTTRDAEERFTALAQAQHMYGMDLYFGKNREGQLMQLGISPQGIQVFRKKYKKQEMVRVFQWKSIKNVQFSKKKFTIVDRVEGAEFTFVYEMQNKIMAKLIWKSAVEQHVFFRRKKRITSEQAKKLKVQGVPGVASSATTAPTMLEAMSASKQRANTVPEDGTLRQHLTLHTDSVVNRLAERAEAQPARIREAQHRMVTLQKRGDGFGLKIVGPQEPSDPAGIFVSRIMPNSAASDAGTIQVKDRILRANGVDLSSMLHLDATEVLRQGNTLSLELVNDPIGYQHGQDKAFGEETAGSRRESTISSERDITKKPRRSNNNASSLGRHSSAVLNQEVQTALASIRSAEGRRESFPTGRKMEIDGKEYAELMEEITLVVPPGHVVGLSLTGGSDDAMDGDSGIYLNKVVDGGVAASDGRLRVGDRLETINGQPIAHLTHTDAVATFKEAIGSGKVSLVVTRSVPSEALHRQLSTRGGTPVLSAGRRGPTTPHPGNVALQIVRAPSGSYGFDIIGPEVDASDPAFRPGIFVSVVYAGGPAAQHAEMRRGVRVHEINNWKMDNVSVKEARTLLLVPTGISVAITVRPDDQGFARYEQASLKQHCSPLVNPTVGGAAAAPELRLVTLERRDAAKSWALELAGPESDGPAGPRGVFVIRGAHGLAVGDQILEVNGLGMGQASQRTAQHTLDQCRTSARLRLASNPFGYQFFRTESVKLTPTQSRRETSLRTVTLERPIRGGFGIKVVGPEGTARHFDGVFVSQVASPDAAKAGVLAGDQIMRINDKDVSAESRDFVVSMLERVTRAEIKLARNPKVFAKYQAQADPAPLEVSLTRGPRGFGMNLCGPMRAGTGEAPGVYISLVDRSSPAGKEDRLRVGRQIVAINGRDVRAATQPQATELLAGAGRQVLLGLADNPTGFQPYATHAKRLGSVCRRSDEHRMRLASEQAAQATSVRTVKIHRTNGNQGLGFSVCGPLEQDSSHIGVFVAELVPGGSGAAQGMQVGDQLMMVNGHDTRVMGVEDATYLLKNSGEVCALVLTRNDQGFQQYAETTQTASLACSGRDAGITLVGGIDQRSTTAFIGELRPGSPAAAQPELLQVGMEVVSINGAPTRAMMNEELRGLLDIASAPLTLEIAENPAGFAPFVSDLRRQRAQYVGRSMDSKNVRLVEIPAGRASGEHGIELIGYSDKKPNMQRSGILVASVSGPAAAKGVGLRTGDQIIEVAGANPGEWANLTHGSIEQAYAALSEAAKRPEPTALVVAENIEAYLHYTRTAMDARTVALARPSEKGVGLGFSVVGPTVKSERESGKGVFIAYVTEGSVAAQAGLKVGDQIMSVNGTDVTSALQDDAVRLIINAGEAVKLRVTYNLVGLERADFAPNTVRKSSMKRRSSSRRSKRRAATYPPLPFYARVLYDYDAAGEGELTVRARDVVQITDVSRADWWEARLPQSDKTGLIPSRAKYERDFKLTPRWQKMLERAEKVTEEDARAMSRRLTFTKKTPEELKAEAVQIHSYQVVELRLGRQANGQLNPPRPLAVVGPEALRVSEALIHFVTNVEFVHAVPHTTRPRREGEINGQDYNFVSKEDMEKGLASKKFIEAGRFKDNLYGTSVESVKVPSEQGKIVVLDTQLKAIHRLQAFADIHPIVVFLQPTSIGALQSQSEQPIDEDTAKRLYSATMQSDEEFGHLFTHVISTGDSFIDAVKSLSQVISQEFGADYWANNFHVLPLTPRSNKGDAKKAKPGARIQTVVLRRNAQKSFGFSVAGGIELDLLPHVVLKIDSTPNVVSGGDILHGDEIIAINNTYVAGETHEKVIEIIKASGDLVELKVLSRTPHKAAKPAAAAGLTGEAAKVFELVRRNLYDCAVPITSRPPKEGDLPGRDYSFVSAEEFDELIKAGIMSEWGKHKGHFYGTVHPETEDSKQRVIRSRTFKSAMKKTRERKGPTHVNTVVLSRLPNGSPGFVIDGRTGEASLPTIQVLSDAQVVSNTHGNLKTGDFVLAVDHVNIAGESMEHIHSLLRGNGAQIELLSIPNAATRETVALEAPGTSALNANFDINVPYTTRDARPGEENGREYHFVSEETFRGLVAMGEMKEWGEGKNNMLYGLRRGANDDAELDRRSSVANVAGGEGDQVFDLERTDKGYGLKVASAVDKLIVGVFVTKVIPGTPADEAKIPVGMQIVSVNGIDTTRADQGVVVDAMRSSDKAVLVTRSNIPDYLAVVKEIERDLEAMGRRRTVRLERPKGAGFGFQIISNPKGQGVRIASVIAQTPAASSGLLFRGDYLVSVNGTGVLGASHDEVLSILKAADVVTLEVCPEVMAGELVEETRRQAAEQAPPAPVTQARSPEEPGVCVPPAGVRIVEVRRTDASFGLKIVCNDDGLQSRVSSITPGGPADQSRGIFLGDVIVSVDGQDTTQTNHDDLIAILRQSGQVVTFGLVQFEPTPAPAAGVAEQAAAQTPPRLAGDRAARLVRRPGEGLGMKVVTDDVGIGAIVSGVTAGSISDESGQIFPGDQIIAINGEAVADAPHSTIVTLLQGSQTIDLVLRPLQQDPADGLQQGDGLHQLKEATLVRGKNGLGMKIATEEHIGGIIVTGVTPGGVADESGQVRPGDVIISVNGQAMLDASHDEAVAALKSSPQLLLKLVHGGANAMGPPPSNPYRSVVLVRDPQRGLGIKIVSLDGSFPRISFVAAGSVADQSQGIVVGDRLVEVNGQPMLNLPHEAIVAALQVSEVALTLQADDEPLLFPQAEPAPAQMPSSPLGAATPVGVTSVALAAPAPAPALVRTVTLNRQGGPLGMKISADEGLGGAHVTAVIAGGAADQSQAIFANDMIVMVNGQDVRSATHAEIVGLLQAPGMLELGLEAGSPLGELDAVRTVTLQRVEGQGLGIRIASNELEQGAQVICIVPGSIADQAGLIRLGDIIVSVNGVPIEQTTHKEIVKLLQPAQITLQLRAQDASCSKRVVTLVGGEEGLGISVAHDAQRGVYVSGVTPNGQASRTNLVFPGDSIDEINGQTMIGADHVAAVGALQAAREIVMVLSAPVPVAVPEGTIVVQRGPGGCGILVNPCTSGYLKVLSVEGPTRTSKPLDSGDVITAINGTELLGMTKEEVLEVLAESASEVILQVHPRHDIRRRVRLVKDKKTGFGLKIASDEDAAYVGITAVTDNGVADKSGLIYQGQLIYEVNGKSMQHATHEQTVEALRSNDVVTLIVGSPTAVDAEGVSQEVPRTFEGSADGPGLRLMEIPNLEGVFIETVTPGSAAEAAGVLPLDRLLEANGANLKFASAPEANECFLGPPGTEYFLLVETRPRYSF